MLDHVTFSSVSSQPAKRITRDDVCIAAIRDQNIIVDPEKGEVYRVRGPGGHALKKPQIMKGSGCNGYLVINLTAGGAKRQVRLSRLIWIFVYGVPPCDLVVAHKNNIKTDNRITNLWLRTFVDNIKDAWKDGLFKNLDKKLNKDSKALLVQDCIERKMKQRDIANKYGVTLCRVVQLFKEYQVKTGYNPKNDPNRPRRPKPIFLKLLRQHARDNFGRYTSELEPL